MLIQIYLHFASAPYFFFYDFLIYIDFCSLRLCQMHSKYRVRSFKITEVEKIQLWLRIWFVIHSLQSPSAEVKKIGFSNRVVSAETVS